MLRAGGVSRDEGKVDINGLRGGERNFSLFGLFLKSLQRHRIFAQVDAVFFFEAIHQPANQRVVPIVSAQMSIAVCRLHLEHAVADFEHRHVKCATAQIEYRDLLVLLFVEAIREGSRRWLIDNAQHLKARDLAGILRRLTLGVVKVSRDGNDGLRDLFAKIGLGIGLQFSEDEGRDLLGRELLGLVARLNLNVGVAIFAFNDLEGHVLRLGTDLSEFATDQAFSGEDGIARIRYGLTLGGLPDQALSGFRKRDDGRRGARPFCVRDDDGLSALHHSHTRISGA